MYIFVYLYTYMNHVYKNIHEYMYEYYLTVQAPMVSKRSINIHRTKYFDPDPFHWTGPLTPGTPDPAAAGPLPHGFRGKVLHVNMFI
jgi:hypothetical protein